MLKHEEHPKQAFCQSDKKCRKEKGKAISIPKYYTRNKRSVE
jgi:hypothetical protein